MLQCLISISVQEILEILNSENSAKLWCIVRHVDSEAHAGWLKRIEWESSVLYMWASFDGTGREVISVTMNENMTTTIRKPTLLGMGVRFYTVVIFRFI